jgi:glutamate racemase
MLDVRCSTFIFTPMDPRPLGIFDSGVGGLTVVRAVRELLPAESIVYLGDTARVPYGSKSPDTIRRFAEEDVRFLLSHDVKAIVVACNTASAHALPALRRLDGLPILGVIEPGVESALSDPGAERVGIIATRATIRSHAYQHALAQRRPGLIILEQPAPLLVPIVEEDWIDHPATELILHGYLDPLIERGMDTLLLACTHYPLLIPRLEQMLGSELRLVDSATTCAVHLQEKLAALDLLAPAGADGRLDIRLTDLSEQFESLAARFLDSSLPRIRRAVLG